MKTPLDDIEEIEIIQEAPRKVRVGDQWVLVRQLTLQELLWTGKHLTRLWLKHQKNVADVLRLLGQPQASEAWWRQAQDQLTIIVKSESVRADVVWLLRKLFPSVGRRWMPFRRSYLERHLTPNALIQLAVGLYAYNFSLVKKNLHVAEEWMAQFQATPLWRPSTSGANGNSTGPPDESLKPRFRKSFGTWTPPSPAKPTPPVPSVTPATGTPS